jgi:hypothetical protein
MTAIRTPVRSRRLAPALTALLVGLAPGAGAQPDEAEFTTDFRLGECRFASTGQNPYFLLRPGYELELAGESDGEEVVVEITVLAQTKTIRLVLDGRRRDVRARVVEEREYIDGELAEVSRNYYAACSNRGDVVYLGEDVDFYEDGEIVGHEGSWRAGVAGASPGLIMPGTFLLGSRYYQEVAPEVAEDRAEHVAMGLDVEVEAGDFSDCVEVLETNPLEPGAESEKTYCPRVGLVVDGDLELVEFGIDD